MKPIVDLYYLSPNPYGGWVTFTAHLMIALRTAGLEPRLFKIRARDERKGRSFGYGETYRNITVRTARQRRGPKLIVAAAKNFRAETGWLMNAGASLVVHDPTELKNLPLDIPAERIVVIRRVGLENIPSATFIPHPYQPMGSLFPPIIPSPRGRAVSTSRIDFDKHTDIILAANRMVEAALRVRIHGFENRLYTRFKICPAFPEWKQSKVAYPRDRDAAFLLLSKAQMMVDMSIIKGDGGGTQYTTLEAWDAGAVPVIHADWLREDDDMREWQNCLAVSSPEDLAEVLRSMPDIKLNEIALAGYDCLRRSHDPGVVGARYREFLARGNPEMENI